MFLFYNSPEKHIKLKPITISYKRHHLDNMILNCTIKWVKHKTSSQQESIGETVSRNQSNGKKETDVDKSFLEAERLDCGAVIFLQSRKYAALFA